MLGRLTTADERGRGLRTLSGLADGGSSVLSPIESNPRRVVFVHSLKFTHSHMHSNKTKAKSSKIKKKISQMLGC